MTLNIIPSSNKVGVALLFKQIYIVILRKRLVLYQIPQIDCLLKKGLFESICATYY